MPSLQQCVWFIEQRHSQRWRLRQATARRSFVGVVGVDVLTHFARCFIHADRLTSLATMVYLSQERDGTESVAFKRDLDTMVWLSAGEVHEFSVATKDLRAELYQRDLLKQGDEQWEKLREIEKCWQTQEFKVARNKLAFHVGPDVIRSGIEALSTTRDEVDLVCGDDKKQRGTAANFAILTGIAGAFPDQSGTPEVDISKYRQFLASFAEDYQKLPPILYDLFVDTLERFGFEILHI